MFLPTSFPRIGATTGDNAPMDTFEHPAEDHVHSGRPFEDLTLDELERRLEHADASDAAPLAEELARRLSQRIEEPNRGDEASGTNEKGTPS